MPGYHEHEHEHEDEDGDAGFELLEEDPQTHDASRLNMEDLQSGREPAGQAQASSGAHFGGSSKRRAEGRPRPPVSAPASTPPFNATSIGRVAGEVNESESGNGKERVKARAKSIDPALSNRRSEDQPGASNITPSALGQGEGEDMEVDTEMLECPICGKRMKTDNQGLNAHIDFCLSRDAILNAQVQAGGASNGKGPKEKEREKKGGKVKSGKMLAEKAKEKGKEGKGTLLNWANSAGRK